MRFLSKRTAIADPKSHLANEAEEAIMAEAFSMPRTRMASCLASSYCSLATLADHKPA